MADIGNLRAFQEQVQRNLEKARRVLPQPGGGGGGQLDEPTAVDDSALRELVNSRQQQSQPVQAEPTADMQYGGNALGRGLQSLTGTSTYEENLARPRQEDTTPHKPRGLEVLLGSGYDQKRTAKNKALEDSIMAAAYESVNSRNASRRDQNARRAARNKALEDSILASAYDSVDARNIAQREQSIEREARNKALEDSILASAYDSVDARNIAQREQRLEREARNKALEDSILASAHDSVDARNIAQREQRIEREARNKALEDSIFEQANESVYGERDRLASEIESRRDAYARQRRRGDAQREFRTWLEEQLAALPDGVRNEVIKRLGEYDVFLSNADMLEALRNAGITSRGDILDLIADVRAEMLYSVADPASTEDYSKWLEDTLGRLPREVLEVLVEMDEKGNIDTKPEALRAIREAYRQVYGDTSEVADAWADATNAATEEYARRRGDHVGLREFNPNNLTYGKLEDRLFLEWQEVPEKVASGGDSAILDELVSRATESTRNDYENLRERGANDGSDEQVSINDAIGKGLGGLNLDPVNDSENIVERKLREIRNLMLRRFLNPTLLRVEGLTVETRRVVDDDGKTVVQARLTFDGNLANPKVDSPAKAAARVAQMYDCSLMNVLRLVTLRAGIGIDRNGLIAKVDPDKFELTSDQFIEICNDIIASQKSNGHPFGPVEGTPGARGVRDDTGRYVVVAGTRCYPMGYMPRQMIYDLSRNMTSPLHGLSERQIQTMINETWLQSTYPEILSSTSGNKVWQARALENMMRAIMAIDGADPSELDIPDIVMRETLESMEAELHQTGSDEVAEAIQTRIESYEGSMERTRRRYMREATHEMSNGNVVSQWNRKSSRNGGDMFGALNKQMRVAGSARLGIMLSGPVEEIMASVAQQAAEGLNSFWLYHRDMPDANGGYVDADQYKYTSMLDSIAHSPETREALEVGHSLYGIGGHDMVDTFLLGRDPNGNEKNYVMTRQGLHEFLVDYGVIGDGPVLGPLGNIFSKYGNNGEAAFKANAQAVIDAMGNGMLSTKFFGAEQTANFLRSAMNEMLSARMYGGRESFTSQQVEEWGMGDTGGEEVVRSLLMTDAGREAFMTEGVTSLARKSIYEHAIRTMLSKNRVVEFAIRSLFDKFPEYGVAKLVNQQPMSNTRAFIAAHGIRLVGGVLTDLGATEVGGAMQRATDYTMGGRSATIAEGLRKCLIYDAITAGSQLAMACAYLDVIVALGGVQPPEDEEDLYTWSEWKIGDPENAIPIKFAWWMDDLCGVGVPLGMALAIANQGGWTNDSKKTASKVFFNAMCNVNSGTVMFDAIDFVNNWEEEVKFITGESDGRETWGDQAPSITDRYGMAVEIALLDMMGDMVPQVINELCPWSKDYVFRTGTDDAHTPYKAYDRGRESKYDAETAYDEYRVTDAGWRDSLLHKAASKNILLALTLDVANMTFADDGKTGYLYTEMPLDTMAEPLMKATYDRFYLSLDPTKGEDEGGGISIDNDEERKAELYSRAQDVVDYIEERGYVTAEQAFADGFVLNFEARANCINYCWHMINEANDRFDDTIKSQRAIALQETGSDWIDNYDEYKKERDDEVDKWKNLLDTYFNFGNAIPWRLPRYVKQESDTETRYVDEQGNPGTYLGTIDALRNNRAFRRNVLGNLGEFGETIDEMIGDSDVHAERYAYGNRTNLSPVTTPISEGKAYNYEEPALWAPMDENGNPVTDTESVYDRADVPLGKGRFEGQDARETYWGGQGSNAYDDIAEEMNIAPNGEPTISERNWRSMTEILPDDLAAMLKDPEAFKEMFGIDSDIPSKDGKQSTTSGDGGDNGSDDDNADTTTTSNSRQKSGGNRSYGGNSYNGGYRRYYYSGSRGGSNAEYNPKIYSSAKQVYGSRGSGMSSRQPYKSATTYLRPNFYTIGSRQSYKRQS